MVGLHSNALLRRPAGGKALLVADALFVGAAFIAVHWFYLGFVIPGLAYQLFMTLGVALYVLISIGRGEYRRHIQDDASEFQLSRIKCWGVTAAILVFTLFAAKTGEDYSRIVVIGWIAVTPLMLAASGALLRTYWRRVLARTPSVRVAIVGPERSSKRFAEAISSKGLSISVVAEAYTPDADSAPIATGREYRSVLELAWAGEVDRVYMVGISSLSRPLEIDLVNRLADTSVSVYLVPDLSWIEPIYLKWSMVGDMPTLGIFEKPFTGVAGAMKRSEDIIVSAVVLIMAAIPMALIAVAVKMTSPGPVLFRQRRFGIDGREIRVWKFRTMTVCEDGDEIRQATKGDQRVTKVGSFLRRSSLDELPQFINVLAGSMSVVGPRPHAVAHNEHYRDRIVGYMLRHKVKPGITGLAQINGCRGETHTDDRMQQRIDHDLMYIRNWSLLLDLEIILRTITVFWDRNTAY